MSDNVVGRVIRAGLITALLDGLFSSVLTVAFYGSTVKQLFKGVASVLFGTRALEGGTTAALVGVLMHVGVAIGWSAVFMVLFIRSGWLRRVLASPYGAVKVGAVYGPFVWMVMSLVVIPLLTKRPPTFNNRWWVQFFGQALFVGLPIAATIGAAVRPSRASAPAPAV